MTQTCGVRYYLIIPGSEARCNPYMGYVGIVPWLSHGLTPRDSLFDVDGKLQQKVALVI